ncbi:MAG TPA: KH domain-containing protein [Myxococcota bacterium]|nr:KH domain-containing protein [Myxococcota bacterium]
MKELVEFIAKTLADEPGQVEAYAADDRVVELRLAPDDVGKIIGRRGKTAKAIRTLLAAAGDGWDVDIAGHGEDEEDEEFDDEDEDDRE